MSATSQQASAPSLPRRCASNVETALRMLLRPQRAPGRRLLPLSARWTALVIVAGIAVFLLVNTTIDARAIRGVAQLPPWVSASFNEITNLGLSGWFLWPLGILFLALAVLPLQPTRMQRQVHAAIMVRVGFLFTAICAPGLVVAVVKRLIGRARPTALSIADPFAYRPFAWRADFASLPSGHATTVFAVLVAFGALWPRARLILWAYALLIAVSRIVVMAHFPSDVLAGAAAGALGAALVQRWFALRGLGASIGPDNRVQPWPVPSLRRLKAVARGLWAE